MPPLDPPRSDAISIRGARQNNLKALDLDLPLNELIVVTGVSGSGKSSLVFDTLYAEGQRRYVETFSPYARQFLDRMDKPAVDRIDGIPPAIAIDQTNPVRTSRSTVGTMTELNDHLKLLFARVAVLHCRGCGRAVRRDSAESIRRELGRRAADAGDPRLLLTFPVTVPANFGDAEIKALLSGQGYTRIHEQRGNTLQVIQDRFRWSSVDPARAGEAIEAALKVGQGRIDVYTLSETREGDGGAAQAGVAQAGAAQAGAAHTGAAGAATPWRFSTGLHCADCDINYRDPNPSTFSFNSPLGACETCRGFGRVIGVDYGLVIPDVGLSLRDGAIKPWQTNAYEECQDDLVKFARKRSIPLDTPWRDLTAAQRDWVLDGEGEWTKNVWYGVKRFFAWLETRAYKMHIRVLLSRYRSYTECPACHGARLKPEALLWRVGDSSASAAGSDARSYNIRELMLLPIDQCLRFFATLALPAPLDDAADLLLREIRARLTYLTEVGLGYLDLDRQSRTLSGGEVQRINLTTALGTSLVSTLFVLDEPSIGLHPRDVGRIVGVMQRLRDAGNTLVVVEHDPKVMRAADRILDIGPGPGEHGGEIVFYGTVGELARATGSLTADYLFQRKRVQLPGPKTPRDAAAATSATGGGCVRLRGAAEHNLKNIDVDIPLARLVCVTGVSGSGKSTLVHDVLYPALLRIKGKPTDNPGEFAELLGSELIDDVIMVDQSRIGRTTRSNPASYVGAFDAIRAVFAKLPQALERKYTAGTFSFNSGNGRCPACAGNGFEHVEMQFLSDVYLRCPDCDGRRYRAEILECRLVRGEFAPKSIADVLELTVSEALKFFAADTEVCLRLAPLADVGLDYLRLGQPVPTLSGGEAQRLKLAGHLTENAVREQAADKKKRRKSLAAKASPPEIPGAQAGGGARGATRADATLHRGSLFLFDEPTTGLHFDDVSKLLRAFRRLIDAGHSLLVIEHNMDVVRAADWIIDLGPEGGDAGGAVVCVGTPHQVMRVAASHTGRALLEAEHPAAFARGVEDSERTAARAAFRTAAPPVIAIRGAREHNLKNIDVDLGRNRFTVVTGVSGSGKSSLAFDILFAEGQRRYLESLNAYARQFVQPASRPDVDAIFGIPPTVAIEQRTSRGGHKSTVATLTEIYHFLRLLYVKLGVQYCAECNSAIEPQSADLIAARLLKEYRGRTITLLAPLIVARKGLYTALAKWARGKGYSELRVDGAPLPTAKWPRLDRFIEHNIELPVATLSVTAGTEAPLREALATALEHGRGVVHVADGAREETAVFSTKRACPTCGTGFPELDPRLFSFNSRHGWCKTCFGTGMELVEFDAEQSGEESKWRELSDAAGACPDCEGERLNPVARHVLFRGVSIAGLTGLPVQEFAARLKNIKLVGRERDIARDLVAELGSRTAFLCDVGLGYLQLNRAAPTLSGGEAQRIRLAAQLGSNLQGVCYVLDEPTIGLHPRDNVALLDTLERLRAKGNTLIVVEHDEDTIRRADHVIDLGPGAGTRGGHVVAEGTAAELARMANSATGRSLAAPLKHSRSKRRAVKGAPSLRVIGATLHNLRTVDATIPLGRLTVVTGVSGSGKSSLARDVLLGNLKRLLTRPSREDRARKREVPIEGCESLVGYEALSRVLEVDQTPIGKTPRSCPATYIGFWDSIRRLYAETTDARIRGFTASRFSFNTAGGRCEACEGQGMQRIEMSFLPDVQVLCDVCGGRRFNQETLAIQFKGRNIGEVLAMSVEDAVEFFAAQRSVQHPLSLLADVGLGYLSLGQPSPTLSGGESQRIKLVAELAKVRTDLLGVDIARREGQHTLYVLDEPTVGLHMADVEKLVTVLQRLVDAGNSVVVIEHNLDIMAAADWIVDLGPEGGAGGGRVVAQGTPEGIVAKPGKSHTARILGEFLEERGIA
jgi:excinuclease ABC subunit A